MNSNAGIAAVPIQAVGPTKKPAKRWEKKTNSSSKHKQKSFVSQTLRPKQCKNKSIGPSVEVKNPNLAHNEASLDVSGVPPPFCSCSGVARRCYKSGPGGWQSSCCTNSLSEYPLPLSPWKPGKRVSGRKMSRGPYGKLLSALAAEGHDLSQPVDLKNHWARHGTNKFVTIK